MATINFKSVGKTQRSERGITTQTSRIPIGIRTPLQLGGRDGLFLMNYSLENQIADNLRNLILTNWGERLCQYDFGADLRPLTANFSSQEDFDNEAVVRIKDAVARWMPFVDLVDFISEVDRTQNKSTAIIKIMITYNIPAAGVEGKKLQVTLYVM